MSLFFSVGVATAAAAAFLAVVVVVVVAVVVVVVIVVSTGVIDVVVVVVVVVVGGGGGGGCGDLTICSSRKHVASFRTVEITAAIVRVYHLTAAYTQQKAVFETSEDEQ